MTTWLQKQRKGDLQNMASRAGISHGDLLKDDLVSALDEHLRANASSYSNDQMFAEFYQRGGSPSKKSRSSEAPAADGEVKKRRRTISVKQEAESPSSNSLVPTTPAAVQSLASRIRLPRSPVVMGERLGAQTAALSNRVDRYLTRSGVKNRVQDIRRDLSSIAVIHAAILVVEAAGLQRNTLPFRHAFDMPAVKPVSPAFSVYVPDYFNLITSTFWAPTTMWLSTSLFIPLFVSYFFNLNLTSTKSKRATPHHEFDPLAFNITKGLLAWLVYSQGFRFGGLVTDGTADIVNDSVRGGYVGMLIGSGIGVLTSLYDVSIFKS